MSAVAHPRRDATIETTPSHLWMSAVIEMARCEVKDSEPHRERLWAWFRAGEPVWMAADGLRQLLRGERIAAAEERERRVIAAGIIGGAA